ncbi:MAG: hypothetical protein HY695_13465 [Deltaproteobacteria bacterium]|nr:hypothetical protein [Deltaproteobacteria bacterium]
MSLGIAFKGPEGIVLAADSRVTLTAQVQGQNVQIPVTYDNATKLLRVAGPDHNFIGAVTYGLGAIGQQEPRTAHGYIPEFEEELSKANTGRLPVQDFAQRLSDFFMRQWNAQTSGPYQGPDMIFLIAGYDPGAPYGRVFEIGIPSRPVPFEHHGKLGDFGIVWGGQKDFAARIIHGFDDRLLNIAQQFLQLADQQRDSLRDHLLSQLQVAIPFPFLPLQDCVDVATFLIRATITIQSWVVGVRGVGGAIDVATITRTEGFKPVQQKSIVGERR